VAGEWYTLPTREVGSGRIETETIVKVKSLPLEAKQIDLIKFFEGYTLRHNGVQIAVSGSFKPTGEVCAAEHLVLTPAVAESSGHRRSAVLAAPPEKDPPPWGISYRTIFPHSASGSVSAKFLLANAFVQKPCAQHAGFHCSYPAFTPWVGGILPSPADGTVTGVCGL